MKNSWILFIFIFFGSLASFSEKSFVPGKSAKVFRPAVKPINTLDSIIFDLASSTITPTYIDIPLIIKSDDIIYGFDYEIQFNLAKLTFSATIDIAPDPSVQMLSFFNPNDLYLRYTTSNAPGIPFPVGVKVTKIRFLLTSPCLTITQADFTNRTTILNGFIVPNRVTNLNFAQFHPAANFTTGPTCINAVTQFSNTSTVQSGTVNAWQWSFSNGLTSSLQNPLPTYTASGAAAGTLIVNTSTGCRDTVVKSFTIHVVPTSVFSYSFNCIKDSVFFTNSSGISAGTITGSSWNFGDQSAPGSLTNPSHHYDASGVYLVSLISTSNFSCTTTGTLLVSLNAKLSANFTSTAISNCIGSSINFVDASTYTVSTINGWNWSFGDGATSIIQNASHTYSVPGTFSVTLVSIGADGCTGNLTQTLTIFGPPVVQFAAVSRTACARTPVSFNDLSTTPVGSTYLWNFGDGNSSVLQNPSNIYSLPGIFPVRLIVTNPAGCFDSLIKNSYLTIDPSPVSGFSLSSKCIFISINFANNTTLSTGSIVSYAWNFGDGRTSSLFNPSNTYSASGSYTVSLTSTSDLGCVGVATQTIDLTPKPDVDFEYTSGAINCSGQALSFRNLSASANGSGYFWIFGDSGTSTLQNPVYTYSTAGTYSYAIRLIVTNPGGCSDSAIKSYNVTLPFAATAFFLDTVIANAVVSFSNLSTHYKNVSWNFGDFQNSDSDNPLHTFPGAGSYKICLTAYNAIDCPNSFCKDIYVGLSNIVVVPSAFTPNQDNFNDVLRVRGGPFIEMDFRIFNEWGNELFSSPEQSLGWDGSFNGEAQPVGSYEYILKGKTIDKKNIRLYGIVNLTR